mmetsp:Transcript_4381/g.13701  ORF Transcript_4381/g.13701 Transcript_4381/m.13701 type:complete len:401 (-) Transcript_4381:52-1254(-)
MLRSQGTRRQGEEQGRGQRRGCVQHERCVAGGHEEAQVLAVDDRHGWLLVSAGRHVVRLWPHGALRGLHDVQPRRIDREQLLAAVRRSFLHDSRRALDDVAHQHRLRTQVFAISGLLRHDRGLRHLLRHPRRPRRPELLALRRLLPHQLRDLVRHHRHHLPPAGRYLSESDARIAERSVVGHLEARRHRRHRSFTGHPRHLRPQRRRPRQRRRRPPRRAPHAPLCGQRHRRAGPLRPRRARRLHRVRRDQQQTRRLPRLTSFLSFESTRSITLIGRSSFVRSFVRVASSSSPRCDCVNLTARGRLLYFRLRGLNTVTRPRPVVPACLSITCLVVLLARSLPSNDDNDERHTTAFRCRWVVRNTTTTAAGRDQSIHLTPTTATAPHHATTISSVVPSRTCL